MPTLVGQKGQVVIEKRIREKLGIKPKSLAIQTLVGDHVEVRFVPPPSKRPLAGSLNKYARNIPKGMTWHEIREIAMAEMARERVSRLGS